MVFSVFHSVVVGSIHLCGRFLRLYPRYRNKAECRLWIPGIRATIESPLCDWHGAQSFVWILSLIESPAVLCNGGVLIIIPVVYVNKPSLNESKWLIYKPWVWTWWGWSVNPRGLMLVPSPLLLMCPRGLWGNRKRPMRRLWWVLSLPLIKVICLNVFHKVVFKVNFMYTKDFYLKWMLNPLRYSRMCPVGSRADDGVDGEEYIWSRCRPSLSFGMVCMRSCPCICLLLFMHEEPAVTLIGNFGEHLSWLTSWLELLPLEEVLWC